MLWALGLATVAVMAVLARRADRRFAGHRHLPMQFGPSGTPGWTAPRAVALGFLPVLALAVFGALWVFAPDPIGALIAALSLLGGQVFYHALIARWARGPRA